jgi:serine/threonine protein kinase
MNAEALIGKVLGTCTLQKVIGQGGMGAVYLAQQSRPRRQVAVKVLLPTASLTTHQRAAFLERFRRETDAAASLEHPNILPVHEYGERDGLAYLVVPYISGGTLRDVLDRDGQLPLPKVLNYLEQMAEALDFAHERGVIHRDIKPANILMTTEGRLLLTDFGLVKIITDGPNPQIRLTGAGAPVGTPDYMSPEQVVGNKVDGRSDLYSLGVILYQMITGSTPFQGETPMQIAAQQWQSPPPGPRLLRADLPIAAEQALLRAMAKRPDDRYATGRAFTEAFRQSLHDSGVLLGNAPSSTFSMGSSTSARLLAPRGLFDPAWQKDATGSVPAPLPLNDLSGGKSTAVLPTLHAASLDTGRSTGLLSRTGMFPRVVGTGHMPVTPANDAQPTNATGVLPAFAESQQAFMSSELGQIPMPTGTYPSPLFPAGAGQLSAATGALPTTSGSQSIPMLQGLSQLSPELGTTGSLMIPGNDQGNTSTMKLTGPVKVVQMPVAGQPGRFVTGLLPVVPQTQEQEELLEKHSRKKPLMIITLALLVLLVLSGVGGSFWYIHAHQGKTVIHPGPAIVVTPNAMATATAQVQATADANKILSDPLSQNIHNFPTGKNEFFTGGTYHILNTEGNAVAVVLPQQPFTIPNAYTLSMWEVKGDDTSNNNSFGMIIRFSQRSKGGKTLTTFYSFEALNIKGGDYRFYKYDDSQGSPDKYWTQLWSQPFGGEYHQGQGSGKENTFRIYQNGSTFSFTVNGKLIKTIHDGSLKSGSLGMLVNLKGTEVAFSNMLITHK